ncbi:MAG: cytochrome c3 family protein [Candidatus Aminicenantales bacterium]
MRQKAPILILSTVFLGWSFLNGQETASAQNAGCLACHGKSGTIEERLRINEEHFSSSVHSSLRCSDCHAVKDSAAQGEVPHQKDIPACDCTASCHREDKKPLPGLDPLLYPDSVHGRAYLERGAKEVAKCWNCHGKHNIHGATDPESSVHRKNIPLTCSTCHEDMAVVVKYNIHSEAPYQEYMKSVHGRALFEKGLLRYAAVCTDCHGVHDIKGVGEPHLMAKQPQTCGACHELIFSEYGQSIHGREALAGNIDSPLCVDCHGEHGIASPKDTDSPVFGKNVPDTCSACHARPEIMKKYGISEDKIGTFIDSLHGIAVGFGSKTAANCASCHGVHDIRPASDPLSRVHPANLRSTCGQADCHPNMPEKIAQSKIHIGPEQKQPAALFYVQRILLVLVVILLAITVLWFVPGFIRKFRLLRRK